MGQVITGAFMAFSLVMLIIIMVILGTFFGGVAGWIVGMFFTDTILTTLSRFGIDTMGMTMWQLDATLGFVSGFFKIAKVQKNG
jgi:hypothetical protein